MFSFNLCCVTTIGIGLKFLVLSIMLNFIKQILKFKYLANGARNLQDDNNIYRI